MPNSQPTTFDVASIRPAVVEAAGGEGSSRAQVEYTPDSLNLRNMNLEELVEWAYGLEHNQVLGPDGWSGQRYDIRAKTDAPVSVSTLHRMVQNLLAARFNLQAHREQRTASVYELIVAKDGPRLPKNKEAMLPATYPKESLPRIVDGDFVFANVSMPDFAKQLTELRGIELPVMDRTGISGVYDITLKSAASAILESGGASLPALIHQQLGLRLVSAKEPIDVLVIDHAEKPSPN